ncbi:MAG: GAF domain-containing protein, partial [Desulfocapsa sp.]|nr:GAF domain-containing protein [Desulfocapsa sp.]
HLLQDGAGVVGADSVLSVLAVLLQKQKLTPSTQIVLLDKNGRVLLSADETDLIRLEELKKAGSGSSLHVKDLKNKVIGNLYEKSIAVNHHGGYVLEVNGKQWYAHGRHINSATKNGINIAIASPFDELMADAQATRKRNFLILFSVVIVALCLGIYFSRRIAEPLRDLSKQAENIKNFKLSTPLTVQSRICEVDQLASSMSVMQTAINRFVEIARALSGEKRMDKVLEMIVKEAQSVAGADGGGIGLVSDDGTSFSYVLVRNTKSDVFLKDEEIFIDPIAINEESSEDSTLEESVIRSAHTKVLNSLRTFLAGRSLPIVQIHEKKGYECYSLLLIPLLNRQDEVIGLLHLVNARDENNEATDFSEDKVAYVKALASNAALALDNNRLIRAQKDLFDSFVRLIAGAIDTKSPYTGGHCQRVPVLAGMLAEAASSTTDTPFKDFKLSEDEHYELFVASWLHDCGKVTTPEYVVDKATKLETIYNRIHEIRTRFEV